MAAGKNQSLTWVMAGDGMSMRHYLVEGTDFPTNVYSLVLLRGKPRI
jgi:hypothetical protein